MNRGVMGSGMDLETHKASPLQLPQLLPDSVPANPLQEGDESPSLSPFHLPSRSQSILRRTPTSYDLRAVAQAQRHANSHPTAVKCLLQSPIPKGNNKQNDDEWQRYLVNRKYNDDYLNRLLNRRQSCSYSYSYKQASYHDYSTVVQRYPTQQESIDSLMVEEPEEPDTHSEANSDMEDDAQILSYYYNESGRLSCQAKEEPTGSANLGEKVVVDHTDFAQNRPNQAQADELGHGLQRNYENSLGDSLDFDQGLHKSVKRNHHSGHQHTSDFYEDEGGTGDNEQGCIVSSPTTSTDSILEPSTPPTPSELDHNMDQCRNHYCDDYKDGNDNCNGSCDSKRARNREAVAFCSSDESGWLANTTSYEERRRRFKARLCQVVQRPWTAELRYNHRYGYGYGTDCEDGDRDLDEGAGGEGIVMIATLLIGFGPGKPKLIQIQRPASSSSRTSSTEPSSGLTSNCVSNIALVSSQSASLDTPCPPVPLRPNEQLISIEADVATPAIFARPTIPSVGDITSGSGRGNESNNQTRVGIDPQQLPGSAVTSATRFGQDNGRADVAIATNASLPVTTSTLASCSESATTEMSGQSVHAVEAYGSTPPSTPIRASNKMKDYLEVSAFSPYDTPGGAGDCQDDDEDVDVLADDGAEFDDRENIGHGYNDGESDVFAMNPPWPPPEPGPGLYCQTDIQPQALRYVTYS
ncbi:hypothetical protein ABEF95_004196 [Exophiala dermatitidis]